MTVVVFNRNNSSETHTHYDVVRIVNTTILGEEIFKVFTRDGTTEIYNLEEYKFFCM